MSTFDNSKFENYKSEVQKKWGQTNTYKQYAENTKDYSKYKWNELSEKMERIIVEFVENMNNAESPDSIETQNLVEKLQKYITDNYYLCTDEILFGLGQMYIEDERFKYSIDKHGAGAALYISKAIEIYCNR